jgi:hypothetical protein
MTNAIITMVLIGAAVFVLAVAADPKLARWLAAVIYARALAVEAGRETYEVVRRSGIVVGTAVYTDPEK